MRSAAVPSPQVRDGPRCPRSLYTSAQTQPAQTMARKDHVSETPATQFLKSRGVFYSTHIYDYVEGGGTAESARQLHVDEHHVVKTLIMEDDSLQPWVVLMHGDCQVSTKNLARQLGVKKINNCSPEVAHKHSGYLVGGTSPFGTRKRMSVCVENSVLQLPLIYINGGQRGYLLGLDPKFLVSMLGARPVQCALGGPAKPAGPLKSQR